MTEPAARARREYGTALAVLAVGGTVLLVAYGLTWATVDVPLLAGSDGAVHEQQYAGRDLYPAAAMSGWVALAGAGGIIATRSWGRVLVAALCTLSGVAGALGAVAFAVAPASSTAAAILALGSAKGDVSSVITLGWLLAAIAGALVAVAGGWSAVRGPSWPRLGSRYERTPRSARATSAWDAQDLGHDPSDDLVE